MPDPSLSGAPIARVAPSALKATDWPLQSLAASPLISWPSWVPKRIGSEAPQQKPSSVLANGLKLRAKESVQPDTTAIQEPSSVLAAAL